MCVYVHYHEQPQRDSQKLLEIENFIPSSHVHQFAKVHIKIILGIWLSLQLG